MGQIRIIGGKWKGRLLNVQEQAHLRPTPNRVRETLFNWLQFQIIDAHCLDLFAGSGVLGFEALSRGAKHVTLVEKHAATFKMLKQAAQTLGCEQQVHLIQKGALQWLKESSTGAPFDIIFLDPPFQTLLLYESIDLLTNHPLIKEKTLVYIEASQPLNKDKLPAFWQVIKEKTAGEVYYHLVEIGAS